MSDDALQRRWAPTLGAVPAERDTRTPIVEGSTQAQVTADKWPATPAFTFNGNPATYTWQYSTGSTTPTIVTTPPAPEALGEKAFVATINGRTFVSGPAAARTAREMAIKDPTVEEIVAQHLLWMHGRFVGADEPNRNGAMWSAGDLELSASTVVNGPLNWLHEARHVIGTLATAGYVSKEEAAAAGEGRRPHINATAAIWKWIWPDEAYVIQQASDLKQLWYSMECISKEVACSGPEGCGNTTSYADYMAGAACEHVVQRAAVRHFKNPVFLGGAVIVPPTRPGWGEADARVMQEATGLAEAAFEQAGRPDIPSSQWEQMMAQLVLFSRG